MIRLAVVGTGSVGRRHLANLYALGCRGLVAVSEHARLSRNDLRPLLADVEFEVVHDYIRALDLVDGVIIANPTSLHLDYTRAAIEAGRHVLCEKPLAASTDGLGQLVDLAQRAAVVAGVGYQFRFNHQIELLRTRLEGGALGTILDVEATQGEHLADYHPEEDYRASYAARSALGGGVLLTQIHQIDLLHWLFGPFDTVLASGGRLTDLEIDVEDAVTYLLRSPSGPGVRGHLDFFQRPRRMDLTVTGTEGTIRWDYYAGSLETTGHGRGATPTLEHTPYDRQSMFLGLLRDFLEAITDGRPPRTSIADGASAVAIVDAMKASLREARSTSISTTPKRKVDDAHLQ